MGTDLGRAGVDVAQEGEGIGFGRRVEPTALVDDFRSRHRQREKMKGHPADGFFPLRGVEVVDSQPKADFGEVAGN